MRLSDIAMIILQGGVSIKSEQCKASSFAEVYNARLASYCVHHGAMSIWDLIEANARPGHSCHLVADVSQHVWVVRCTSVCRIHTLTSYFYGFYSRRSLLTMSLLNHAQNVLVQGHIAATQVNGNAYNAEVTNVATQNNYHGPLLKGALAGIRFHLFSD